MKICFAARFHFAERVGGAEVQAWLLAAELARRGHAVSYICESLSGKGGRSETIEGVEVVWLEPRAHLDILNLPRYARGLRQLDPDIVIHRYTSGYELAIGRFCRRKGAKFVWICTDNASPVRRYFVTRQRDILKRHARPFYKRLVLLLHAWAKDRSREYGMRFVTNPCVQNPVQRDAYLANFGQTPFRFPSGQIIPPTIPKKDSPPVILWVGGFSAVKRPELFLQLAQSCEDRGLHFVMISKKVPKNAHTAPNPFYRYAETQPRFSWLIELSFDEALAWFDRASVLVCTSESEGFPNTFVQAWARGVPVVSLSVDPNGVLTRDGLGKCVDSLAEARAAILDYINDPALPEIRAHLHKAARTRFDIRHVADRLFEILAQDRCTED